MEKLSKLAFDFLLAAALVLVGIFIAGLLTAAHAGAQAAPAACIVEVKIWHLSDPADPALVELELPAPAWLIELYFRPDYWPATDHKIEGLTRQYMALFAREYKAGSPIITRAFVQDGSGEAAYIYRNGARGLLRSAAGIITFLF